MWELEFGVVEQARASGHGRSQGRREERTQCDSPVVVIREERSVAHGWTLDVSASGARLVVSAEAAFVVGERVQVYIGSDFFVSRVVWAYDEDGACVFGVERVERVEEERPQASTIGSSDSIFSHISFLESARTVT